MSAVDRRAAYISGLRKLADLLEQNPTINLPYATGTADTPAQRVTFYMLRDKREDFAAVVRRFPGPLTKEAEGRAEGTYGVAGKLDGLYFDVVATRSNVCERVVTGTREVTVTIPDPSIEVPTVEVTKTVEDVEWVCGPLLAEAGA